MKIAYITAGAAGMYCGSCLQDNTLVRTLRAKGMDIALIPCYTPIKTDEVDASTDKVFLTGINVYLKQKYAWYRRMPRLVTRVLENRWLLKAVSRISISTDAKDLGSLVLGVLEGEAGALRDEVDRLVAWLRDDFEPDVVHLTNAMLVGFVHRIKEELDVPVVTTLQGEDLFLDELAEPFKTHAFEVLRERCAEVDAFVVHSAYYRGYMPGYLHIPPEKVHVVHLGLELEDQGKGPGPLEDEPYTIGFMARRSPEKGLDYLVEGFKILADRVGKDRVKLRVAGYLAPKDKGYYEEQVGKLRRWGLIDRTDLLGEVDRAGKLALLGSIHVLSIPEPYREPKGIPILEAMANGVPCVQPDHGAFPELIEKTGGGILVEPKNPTALADGLQALMEDPDRRRALGAAGREAVFREYNTDRLAELMMAVYKGLRAPV